MKVFDHKNIVKLLGVCTKGEPAYAVMELMIHGMKQNSECVIPLASPQTSFGVRSSRIRFSPTWGNERTPKDVCGEAIIPSAYLYK